MYRFISTEKFFGSIYGTMGTASLQKDLPFIFDRFYRARRGPSSEVEGNGLGLAIVKSIAEQHGGRVNAESIQGQGTSLYVQLPLVFGEKNILNNTEEVVHAE